MKKSKDVSVEKVKFIDLFAGLGGTRIGFEQACDHLGVQSECVFTSEIKEHAIAVYKDNFKNSKIDGDVTKIEPWSIPDFDFLLAGFPCQPFSSAGKRNGFLDKRGGLFFTIYEILKSKAPTGFLLENVDGLVAHNGGKTLEIILSKLESLKYQVAWKILDSSDFGVPQKRKRIYIAGHKNFKPALDEFKIIQAKTRDFIEYDAPVNQTAFTKLLLDHYTLDELHGKSIKDKRGGKNNIHSWDLEVKGAVSKDQKKILELILRKRRYKKWAISKGIDWMDGMPLTLEEIRSFHNHCNLEVDLNDLTQKGYLRFEHPKQKVVVGGVSKRVPFLGAPKGYNIVAGKLSFPLASIIDPDDFSPTIVATEAGKIGVATQTGVRSITIREGLRFSGFPFSYEIKGQDYSKAFDLIGNTVMPPVIKAVALKILSPSDIRSSCR